MILSQAGSCDIAVGERLSKSCAQKAVYMKKLPSLRFERAPFVGAMAASVVAAEKERGRARNRIRQAALANSAFLALLQGHPVAANMFAGKLLEVCLCKNFCVRVRKTGRSISSRQISPKDHVSPLLELET